MATIVLDLLGGFEIRPKTAPPSACRPRRTGPCSAFSPRTTGRSHSRDALVALLWDELPRKQARGRLRQALWALRRTLNDAATTALVVDGDAVTLDPAAVRVDVAEFVLAASRSDPDVARPGGGPLSRRSPGRAVGARGAVRGLAGRGARAARPARTRHPDAIARLTSARPAPSTRPCRPRSACSRSTRSRRRAPDAHAALRSSSAAAARRSASTRAASPSSSASSASSRTPQTRVAVPGHPPRDRPMTTAATRPQCARAGRTHRARADGRRPDTPLVGRERELAVLRAPLRGRGAGRGRVVAVVGEAGIGKSASGRASSSRRRRHGGARVLLGRAYESDQVLALGPWADALRRVPLVDDLRSLLARCNRPGWPRSTGIALRPRRGPSRRCRAARTTTPSCSRASSRLVTALATPAPRGHRARRSPLGRRHEPPARGVPGASRARAHPAAAPRADGARRAARPGLARSTACSTISTATSRGHARRCRPWRGRPRCDLVRILTAGRHSTLFERWASRSARRARGIRSWWSRWSAQLGEASRGRDDQAAWPCPSGSDGWSSAGSSISSAPAQQFVADGGGDRPRLRRTRCSSAPPASRRMPPSRRSRSWCAAACSRPSASGSSSRTIACARSPTRCSCRPRRKLLHRRVAEALESIDTRRSDAVLAALGTHYAEAEVWEPRRASPVSRRPSAPATGRRTARVVACSSARSARWRGCPGRGRRCCWRSTCGCGCSAASIRSATPRAADQVARAQAAGRPRRRTKRREAIILVEVAELRRFARDIQAGIEAGGARARAGRRGPHQPRLLAPAHFQLGVAHSRAAPTRTRSRTSTSTVARLADAPLRDRLGYPYIPALSRLSWALDRSGGYRRGMATRG